MLERIKKMSNLELVLNAITILECLKKKNNVVARGIRNLNMFSATNNYKNIFYLHNIEFWNAKISCSRSKKIFIPKIVILLNLNPFEKNPL